MPLFTEISSGVVWDLDEQEFASGELYEYFVAQDIDRDVAYCLIDLAIRVRRLERVLNILHPAKSPDVQATEPEAKV